MARSSAGEGVCVCVGFLPCDHTVRCVTGMLQCKWQTQMYLLPEGVWDSVSLIAHLLSKFRCRLPPWSRPASETPGCVACFGATLVLSTSRKLSSTEFWQLPCRRKTFASGHASSLACRKFSDEAKKEHLLLAFKRELGMGTQKNWRGGVRRRRQIRTRRRWRTRGRRRGRSGTYNGHFLTSESGDPAKGGRTRRATQRRATWQQEKSPGSHRNLK